MTNHPNRGRSYKGHTITRSASVKADTLRPLYGIEGRFSKEAAHRPFITSVSDAKSWINEQIEAAQ